MATKHTPGPWRLSGPDTVVGPSGNVVAECCGYSVQATDKAQQAQGGREANARLIARAPETTDTLRAALAWWHSDTRRMLAKKPDWVKDARRILAEINEEGESMTDSKTKTVIRCPHCGNTDLDKMQLFEYVERYWQNSADRTVLRTVGGRLVVDAGRDEINVDSTSGELRMYCHACAQNFDLPKGIEIEWE